MNIVPFTNQQIYNKPLSFCGKSTTSYHTNLETSYMDEVSEKGEIKTPKNKDLKLIHKLINALNGSKEAEIKLDDILGDLECINIEFPGESVYYSLLPCSNNKIHSKIKVDVIEKGKKLRTSDQTIILDTKDQNFDEAKTNPLSFFKRKDSSLSKSPITKLVEAVLEKSEELKSEGEKLIDKPKENIFKEKISDYSGLKYCHAHSGSH